MGKKRKILNSPKYAAKYAKHPLARAKARKSAVVEVVEAVMDTVEEVVETVAETVQAVVEDITEAVAPPKGLAKRRPGKKYKKSEG